MYITPPKLRQGDKVALLAPASYLENEEPVIQAETLLAEWGLVPVRGKYLMERHGHFAGTDEQRLKDLQEALDNPEIKAIWMVRGGYGMMRILPEINFKVFRERPKWIVGFSDITALHNALHLLKIKSIHASMPQQLVSGISQEAKDTLHAALSGTKYKIKRDGCTLEKPGSFSGVLTGGNLSLVTALLGTRYQPDYKNKILFIEEVGEPLYKIDRMVRSLDLAGVFEQIKGLVLGYFTEINSKSYSKEAFYQIFVPLVNKYNLPVLFDLPSGHIPDNRALVLGDHVEVNVGEFVSCVRFFAG